MTDRPRASSAVCTIVARNYLAQAQVLARSFRVHQPQVDFHTLVIDADADTTTAPPGVDVGTLVRPADLDLDPHTLHSMLAMYDVMELATALKPAMLRWLVHQGYAAVAYFDPDTRLFAPIDDVFAEAATHEIVLTPHTVGPIPRDGLQLNEQVIMQAGIYNLGFIAVGASGIAFLDWWHTRLATDAINDVERGFFTDQRWIDWVPALFPHKIDRDRGLNVAYWNLHDREISLRDGRWFANDVPLRFFHFSGYDPETPWLLSKHMGNRPRILLSERPALRALCDEYARELVEAGHPALRKQPYGRDRLPNGSRLARHMRLTYRDVLLGHLPTDTAPPDPVLAPDEFVHWLTTPSFSGAHDDLSVAEYGLWRSRHDLRQQFPDVFGGDARTYRTWLTADEQTRREFRELTRGPVPLRVRAVRRRVQTSTSAVGWTVAAYARSELGVGEAGRRLAAAIELSGLPHELLGVPIGNLSRQRHLPSRPLAEHVTFDNVVACVNADQVAAVDEAIGLGGFGGVRAGLWFWELAEFPERWEPAFDRLDEVWAASEFNRATFQAHTDKPVRLVRLPMSIPSAPTRYTRRSLGMPENKHVLLTNFDYLSVHGRKNPVGTVRAYCAAFGPDDGAVLLVKSINGHLMPLDQEEVRSAAVGRTDVVFVDGYVSAAEMAAMIELADTYVSLHRSEGYGLNMADAMARRTPVVATGYSGNMDFMDVDTAELIGYDLVEVGSGHGPYDPEATWADPDLEAAAVAMRRLFDDTEHAVALAKRAEQHLLSRFGAETIGRHTSNLIQVALQEHGARA